MANQGITIYNNRNNAPKTYNFVEHPLSADINLGGIPNWPITTGTPSGFVPVIPAFPKLGENPNAKQLIDSLPGIFNLRG